MCNIGLQLQQNNTYKFIFAANRDEAYMRPTKAAHFWPDRPELLAGQDKLKKGTWLGITKQGKFAALTNCRQTSSDHSTETSFEKSFSTSRGTLVKNFLIGNQTASEYAAELIDTRDHYDGYNLIFGNILEGNFLHYNNFDHQLTTVSPGTHGLSNASLDTPWPKVKKVITGMKQLDGDKGQVTTQLFALFADETVAEKENLPNTGLPFEFEQAASAVFIRTKEYGTVGTTVILVDQENKVTFTERRFNEMSKLEENSFSFSLDS
ncbi:NRDE family protein [Desemzia sp. RIT804]|uniref:NRDE family protein n=1 Tax=Desemzia sp. RIT 804 TaxID=2810209 RepID=UPI00194FC0FD|nr:NRDE family protein [Desemzia sp. RIT 804]MBM6615122.1 NRDE family protein [Desemzia sp. RIT 804]